MKAFLKSVALFSGLQVLMLALVFYSYTHYGEHYLSGGIIKRHRLKHAKEPRIVFVGGSSLAFGIDSKKVEEKLLKNPVNMGLTTDLGLDFMLAEAQNGLRPGDIVILAPEYELYFMDLRQWAFVLQQIVYSPELVVSFNCEMLKGTLDNGLCAITFYLNRCFHRNPELGVYRKSAFNEYGDLVLHRTCTSKSNLSGLSKDTNIRTKYLVYSKSLPTTIRNLTKMQQWCQRRQIKVYLAYPPIADFAYDESISRLIVNELKQSLPIPHLYEPKNAVYPAEYFYDTQYHLNWQGTIKHTEMLISCLEKQIRLEKQ